LATQGLAKRSVANCAESIKKEPPMEHFSTGGFVFKSAD